MENRRAEIHEVPDAVKHNSWVGRPLFLVTVYEGKRIFDTHEADSAAEGATWAQTQYGLAATVRGQSGRWQCRFCHERFSTSAVCCGATMKFVAAEPQP